MITEISPKSWRIFIRKKRNTLLSLKISDTNFYVSKAVTIIISVNFYQEKFLLSLTFSKCITQQVYPLTYPVSMNQINLQGFHKHFICLLKSALLGRNFNILLISIVYDIFNKLKRGFTSEFIFQLPSVRFETTISYKSVFKQI